MAEINLSDSKGRDAVVSAESVTIDHDVRWVDGGGSQVASRKILRATMEHGIEALIGKCDGDMEAVAKAMVDSDPEVDVEAYGAFLEDTSRVYVDKNKAIVHKVTQMDVVYGPDGVEKERRPKEVAEQNVSTEVPLRWTGKLLKKDAVYNKFVFALKMQISHINGLTYDFLFSMAKELEEADSLLLLGGGAKGAEPLVFRRSGSSYRGFLEGRTQGDKYALVLHLSNMELKALEESGK